MVEGLPTGSREVVSRVKFKVIPTITLLLALLTKSQRVLKQGRPKP